MTGNMGRRIATAEQRRLDHAIAALKGSDRPGALKLADALEQLAYEKRLEISYLRATSGEGIEELTLTIQLKQ
jgi:hypothetical protein